MRTVFRCCGVRIPADSGLRRLIGFGEGDLRCVRPRLTVSCRPALPPSICGIPNLWKTVLGEDSRRFGAPQIRSGEGVLRCVRPRLTVSCRPAFSASICGFLNLWKTVLGEDSRRFGAPQINWIWRRRSSLCPAKVNRELPTRLATLNLWNPESVGNHIR